MIGILLNLLFWVILAVVLFYVAEWLIAKGELDPPIRKIILLVLALVFLFAIINVVTGHQMWGPVFPAN